MEVGQEVLRILVVDDNPDDVLIVKKALREAGVGHELYVARDGQEALEFLLHQDQYEDAAASPKPGLILLDINMPKLSGLEVLKKIKQAPDLKTIPVIMLTSSTLEDDVIKSYGNGCNSFIQKPVDFDKFVEIVREVGLYWGRRNISPTRPSG